ncbi:MAG: tetratricopeptide repeat protein [Gammaproteobacteria bacterium]|nr:tetratricopeptide repeat protein [Gammaproteobacteria bacterium]
MTRDAKFWVALAVFQVVFGLAVFAITRDYYQQEPAEVRAHPGEIDRSTSTWQGISENDIARLAPGVFAEATPQDPVQISRQADEFFANRQYQSAANSYERLLTFDPENVEVLNNLGLTLHYLGRSDEALRRLNEGVAIDPGNQRIWLTLGYVNGQLGNTEQSRTALTKATETGTDEAIRRSAIQMLEDLP